MVAALDVRHIPASPPPTQNPGLRRDCIRVAEYVNERHLAAVAPPDPQVVWGEVADDILTCLEQGRLDRLRPTPWAVRVRYAWWFEMSWLGRTWYRVRGKVPRTGGRPLGEVMRAEPGTSPARGPREGRGR